MKVFLCFYMMFEATMSEAKLNAMEIPTQNGPVVVLVNKNNDGGAVKKIVLTTEQEKAINGKWKCVETVVHKATGTLEEMNKLVEQLSRAK